MNGFTKMFVCLPLLAVLLTACSTPQGAPADASSDVAGQAPPPGDRSRLAAGHSGPATDQSRARFEPWIVDFANYSFPGFGPGERISLRHGKATSYPGHCIQEYSLSAVDVLDIDGDGPDEALVQVTNFEACGSSSNRKYFYVFGDQRGRPVLLWKFATGSEAHGGLIGFSKSESDFIFDLYGRWQRSGRTAVFREDRQSPDDCCPTTVTHLTFGWTSGGIGLTSLETRPFEKGNIYAAQ
jgi:hypothetical protein